MQTEMQAARQTERAGVEGVRMPSILAKRVALTPSS
jgi:hypothetical protein